MAVADIAESPAAAVKGLRTLRLGAGGDPFADERDDVRRWMCGARTAGHQCYQR